MGNLLLRFRIQVLRCFWKVYHSTMIGTQPQLSILGWLAGLSFILTFKALEDRSDTDPEISGDHYFQCIFDMGYLILWSLQKGMHVLHMYYLHLYMCHHLPRHIIC